MRRAREGPDFTVSGGSSEDEGTVELGAAWSKTSKAGKAYLSVKLDGPMLALPVNCALIQQQDETYALVWTRKDTDGDTATA